jgi:uncharacterized membrane protein
MTCQVSGMPVNSVISFFSNTVILALSVDIAAGLP